VSYQTALEITLPSLEGGTKRNTQATNKHNLSFIVGLSLYLAILVCLLAQTSVQERAYAEQAPPGFPPQCRTGDDVNFTVIT